MGPDFYPFSLFQMEKENLVYYWFYGTDPKYNRFESLLVLKIYGQ